MQTQSFFDQCTNTRFLLHSAGTLSVVAFYVTLDWSVPGLIWGLTLSQFFYGIVYYAAWQWPKGKQSCTPDLDIAPGTGGLRPPEESFLLSLVFFIFIYGMTYLMVTGYAFAMFPLTGDNNFASTLMVAIEIYWPVVVTVFIARFRDLPWGQVHRRDSFMPFLPNSILVVIMKAPIVVMFGALILDQGWDFYGPVIILIAAIYFYDLKLPKALKPIADK